MTRAWAWVWRVVGVRAFSKWPDVLLLACLTLSLDAAVRRADWVADSRPISASFAAGFVLGALLVSTHWKGWWAGLYSLFFSALFTCQAVGAIIPPFSALFSQPLLSSVAAGRIQAVAFALRVGGWIDTVRSGGSVEDTGLFLVVFAWLGSNLMVYLVWWVMRRRQALVGLLPVGVLMAVNAHLGDVERIHTAVFLFFALVLVARCSFDAQLTGWMRRKVDYSEELGAEWGVSAVTLGLVIGVVALTFSFVGTPEGWRAIRELMERNRQQMSDTAEQLFGGVNPPRRELDAQGEDDVRIATPNLSEIGAPIAQGDQIVFTVQISDPPPVQIDARGGPVVDAPRHYWRSQIFSVYTGRGWTEAAVEESAQAASEAEDSAPPGRYRLEQHFTVKAAHSGALFSVNQPFAASGGASIRPVSPDRSGLVYGEISEYDVSSYASSVTVAEMAEAPTDYPAEIQAAYLQLPEELPERVRTLATEVAGGGAVYLKATRIQNFLRERYAYDLTTGAPAPGVDVVDHFLFETQAGFCSHFATSMAVMLRAVGVPARVAAGYAMGSYNDFNQAYQVPVSASHAWVEVYFPGFGWVEFEPTPAYATFTYAAGAASAAALTPGDLPAAPATSRGQPLLVWLLLPVVFATLLWLAFFWLRRARLGQSDGRALALACYRRAKQELGWAGVHSADSLTPHEFRSRCAEALAAYPRLSDGLRQVTDVYVRAAYSAHAPALHEARMGQWRWQQARWEWLRLLLKKRVFSR